ncbi:ARM repeat-containing protein [Dentipellis sp. KUC8613]|nr:ARM repeat-containing protein [Dentipellis sp. KUC8613]
MGSTAQSQSFVPFYKSIPESPSRSLSSSIWAPQPQPNETTWPQAIASFSRSADEDKKSRPEPVRAASGRAPPTAEDVFGPVGFLGDGRKKDVGAIGDGRKKNSPDMDNIHVEQLLRALNLNSPAPFTQAPRNINTSPDLSPVSVTSALMTPTDSPARAPDLKLNTSFDYHPSVPSPQGSLLDSDILRRSNDMYAQSFQGLQHPALFPQAPNAYPFFDSFSEATSPTQPFPPMMPPAHRGDPRSMPSMSWRPDRLDVSPDWLRSDDNVRDAGILAEDNSAARSPAFQTNFPDLPSSQPQSQAHEPINFLSLLHPSSSPPYHLFVSRIIKSSDQQASIFLQQKLKVADLQERGKIIDAICAKGFEMMAHRFGNWAVQRCLEAASTPDERRKIVHCMRGRIVELASNCYGCHVLQKALDCEEDVRLLIVSELLLGDPAQTLVNKHASHVWSKIMELTWTSPAPPIFAYVNKSLKGKWASLACHETGSLVVQHAFENLEESAKDGIVDELLNQGQLVFSEVAKNQWGSYCIQHILEHGSAQHRQMTLDHLVAGLLEFATNEQGSKSITKALKEGGKETLDKIVKRMSESAKGGRRAIIVDLALSVTGSQLIAAVLPNVDKDQRTLLYDSIRGHIVTLRGCKTGSKVIWLL